MSITTTTSGNITHIIISDRFDYSVHSEFRKTYKNTSKENQFIIDMNRATYLDSSALGMLLLLRDHVNERSDKISIIGCNPEIKNILEMSKFTDLFNVS